MQLFQHHLLKRPSFFHSVTLVPLPKVSWLCWCGSISKISVLFFWLLCLSLSQFNIISIIASNHEYWNWMASPTQWTWVWVNSRSWWWTGRPGMLWSVGSQRIGHNWATELNWFLWLIDLTFQVPMKYCPLQHQTLLPHRPLPQLGIFTLVLSLHSFWSYFSTLLQ